MKYMRKSINSTPSWVKVLTQPMKSVDTQGNRFLYWGNKNLSKATEWKPKHRCKLKQHKGRLKESTTKLRTMVKGVYKEQRYENISQRLMTYTKYTKEVKSEITYKWRPYKVN